MTTKRRFPWWLLLVAFIVVPLVEIYTIIQIGQVIGAWWTILLLIADSIFGGWLVKREGRRAWRALSTALNQGRMPATELADGALILIGGTLMLTPGFVSDIFGILLILPFTRPIGRRVLARVIGRKLVSAGGFGGGLGGGLGAEFGGSAPGQQKRPASPGANRGPQGGPDVVTGEVVD